MNGMETELKQLRIDRSSRRTGDGKPVLKFVLLAIILGAAAVGSVLVYGKLTAPIAVKVVRTACHVASLQRAASSMTAARTSSPYSESG